MNMSPAVKAGMSFLLSISFLVIRLFPTPLYSAAEYREEPRTWRYVFLFIMGRGASERGEKVLTQIRSEAIKMTSPA